MQVTKLEAEIEQSKANEQQFRELSNRTKSEVDSWAATVNRFQPKYMAALRDRGNYEKERDEARRKADALSSQLDASRAEADGLRDRTDQLARKLGDAQAALANASNPDVARLANLEADLEKSAAHAAALDRKLVSARKDAEYAQEAYQEASRAQLDLRAEADDLRRRVDDQARRAANNVRRINEVQARNEARELARLLAAEKRLVAEHQAELSRQRDELNRLATAAAAGNKNGRAARDTRAGSAPWSPRPGPPGVPSPRTAAGGAGTRTTTSSSRAGSPVTALDGLAASVSGFFHHHGQQAGGAGGRWGHLRD